MIRAGTKAFQYIAFLPLMVGVVTVGNGGGIGRPLITEKCEFHLWKSASEDWGLVLSKRLEDSWE